MGCDADDLDATQEAVTDRVNSWMDATFGSYPDSDPIDDADEVDEDEDEDEYEDEYEENEHLEDSKWLTA